VFSCGSRRCVMMGDDLISCVHTLISRLLTAAPLHRLFQDQPSTPFATPGRSTHHQAAMEVTSRQKKTDLGSVRSPPMMKWDGPTPSTPSGSRPEPRQSSPPLAEYTYRDVDRS
jgi:hypothetical protein